MLKNGKALELSKISVEVIKASGQMGVNVLRKLGQYILDGVGMLTEWKSSVIIPLYKNKGDVRDCGSYRKIKILERRMKITERVFEKKLVNFDDSQFWFRPGMGTTDALFDKTSEGIQIKVRISVFIL